MEAKGNKKKDGTDESRIGWFFKAAMRVLIKVKKFCVGAITDCSTGLDYGAALSCPGQVPATLPHSLSVNSTNSSSRRVDYNGISRAGSTKNFAGHGGQRQPVRKGTVAVVPRSYSVGIGKIDEEKESDFGEEEVVNANAYPRSRSSAL